MRNDDATTRLLDEAAAMLRTAPGRRPARYRAAGVAAIDDAGAPVVITVDEGAEFGRGVRGEGNPASRAGAGAAMGRSRGVLMVARTGEDGVAVRPIKGATFALVDADGEETSIVWMVNGPAEDSDGLWRCSASLNQGAGS